MTTSATPSSDAVVRRLRRATGQLAAVARMVEEGRSCDEVVTQMAAVAKAVNTAAFTMIGLQLRTSLEAGGEDATATADRLQQLFLSLA